MKRGVRGLGSRARGGISTHPVVPTLGVDKHQQ